MAESQHILTLTPEQLLLGMYVQLPHDWLPHSFLRNRFLIRSDKPPAQLRQSGLKRIEIDLSNSQLPHVRTTKR